MYHIANFANWFVHAHLPGYRTACRVEHSITRSHMWGVLILLAMLTVMSILVFLTFNDPLVSGVDRLYYPYYPYSP